MPHHPRGRHGVSPLIGAVLLIALVMGIAGILVTWVSSFATGQADAVDNRTDQSIACSYAGLFIEQVLFDDTTDTVDVTVSNSGTVDLANVTILVMDNVAVANRTFITNLAAGGPAKTATVTYKKGEQPDRARAISKQCPSVSDEESNIGIK